MDDVSCFSKKNEIVADASEKVFHTVPAEILPPRLQTEYSVWTPTVYSNTILFRFAQTEPTSITLRVGRRNSVT